MGKFCSIAVKIFLIHNYKMINEVFSKEAKLKGFYFKSLPLWKFCLKLKRLRLRGHPDIDIRRMSEWLNRDIAEINAFISTGNFDECLQFCIHWFSKNGCFE